jgi:hypothetical protein
MENKKLIHITRAPYQVLALMAFLAYWFVGFLLSFGVGTSALVALSFVSLLVVAQTYVDVLRILSVRFQKYARARNIDLSFLFCCLLASMLLSAALAVCEFIWPLVVAPRYEAEITFSLLAVMVLSLHGLVMLMPAASNERWLASPAERETVVSDLTGGSPT